MSLRKRVDLIVIAAVLGWLLLVYMVAEVMEGKDLAAASIVFGYFFGYWHGTVKCRMRYTAATDASSDTGHRG